METEIEAIFTDINKDTIRTKLTKLGADCIHTERIQKRKNYDFIDMSLAKKKGWVRLRDEGHAIVLTYKQMDKRSIDGMKEINITVDDFAITDSFLETIGLKKKSYQETKCESWKLDDVEIEIDEWPWLPPFIEIEGENIKKVEETANKLGFKMSDATYGAVNNLYAKKYKLENDEDDVSFVDITFEKNPPWQSRG